MPRGARTAATPADAARSRRGGRGALPALALLALAGCTVGPDFTTPPAEVAATWVEASDPRVKASQPVNERWWQAFNDPLLNQLVELAYANNQTLEIAGVRVLQARAALGERSGEFYPQQQGAQGGLTTQRRADPTGRAQPFLGGAYEAISFGLATNWEIDFWGKYRRAIESADGNLLAAISAYDDAVVTLVADVATVYVNIRVLQRRIEIAEENVRSQRGSLGIANSRFSNGETSALDVAQAQATLAETQAQIPQFQSDLAQAKYSLALLLGLPPDRVEALLAPGPIPTAPAEVAVGIPVDLLRRRPDVREAEYAAAAQSALIGVAEANLYPAFSLSGSFGFASSNLGSASLGAAVSWSSHTYSFGPAVSFPFLNYGQLSNEVRQQDAAFQAAILNYQFTVLQAQQEVESGLATFLQGQEVVERYRRAVRAARRTTDLSFVQYRDGSSLYTNVLNAQQSQLRVEDTLAVAEGNVPLGLIATYRALGGGWELRAGGDFVSDETKREMGTRTDWGDLLEPEQQQAPEPEAEDDDGWFPSIDW